MDNYALISIKERVSALEAGRFYGLQINRSGFCCCPFHGEKTPSLKLYDSDRGFHCYGCGANGDVITLVQRLFGLSFPAALDKINVDFGLGLPIGRKPTLREHRRSEQIHAQMIRRKTERQQAQADYDAALDEWCRLDRIIRDCAPKSIDDITDDYISAVSQIDAAAERLNEMEEKLNGVERRHNRNAFASSAAGK